MQKVSISEARENLPKITEEVYLKGKTFLITKRGLTMAKITNINGGVKKKKVTRVEIEKAVKAAAGIWKNRWKGKTTEEVVEMLRKKAWYSHAS